MSSVSSLLEQKLSLWPVHARQTLEVERAFRERCRATFDRHARILAGVVLAGVLLWWPFDALVFRTFPNVQKAMSECRIVLALATGLYLVFPRPPWLARYIPWLFSVASCVCCCTAAYTAGRMGGLDKHYFHMLYLTLLAPILLPLQLGPRAALCCAMAISTLAGLLVPFPQNLHSPHLLLAISWLIFSSLLSIWFGYVLFMLSRENFLQAYELAEHGHLLESRVAERTRELSALLSRIEKARESERRRIARELHDDLGQELSALRYSLGFTRRRYEKEPTEISANLADLDGLLERTVTTIRNLIAELRPRVLDDLGLTAAARWLLSRTKERSQLDCHLSVEGEIDGLDDRVATTAFRVLQEALTNTVRHAKAQRVDVAVAARDGTLELRITDDGIGLSAALARASRSGTHVGIIGMRERGHSLGGQVQVIELASGGTEVYCRLPLTPVSEEEPQ